MKPNILLASILIAATLAASPAAAAPAPAPAPDPVSIGEFTVQPSVDLLKRLKIITGDPDGNMRLGDAITRAELAKIIAVTLGQTGAADKALAAAPAFPDLKNHWARGYVAVARQRGIVSGYEDGTFRPDAPVTHAEALTMLLRAEGLKPTGPWPAAYLDLARGRGILTDGLAKAIPAQAKATRAAVFLLADRCFSIPIDDKGRTLLQQNFDVTPPKITVSAPGVVGGTTSSDTVTLTISAPGAIMVRVNGAPVWPSGGLFTTTLALKPGRNSVYILATDEMDNTVGQPFDIERK